MKKGILIIVFTLLVACANDEFKIEEGKETGSGNDIEWSDEEKGMSPGKSKEKKEEVPEFVTVTKLVDGIEVIENPENLLTLVNRTNTLPSNYTPTDLVVPEIPFIFEEILDKRFLRIEVIPSIERLFIEAEKEGVQLFAVSGFRSYERQESIFKNEVERFGLEEAVKYVALPGQSEHQLGLALDVTSISVGLKLTEDFGDTIEGKWLNENAHRFGFIIRYPRGKESLTGYGYEPWHIRYVGNEAADYLFRNNLVLEQIVTSERH